MDVFTLDTRLGIRIPHHDIEWEALPLGKQEQIVLMWEYIRETIPDRIKELERTIHVKQQQLDDEDDFETSCSLNTEISDLASIINDLQLWYRVDVLLYQKG